MPVSSLDGVIIASRLARQGELRRPPRPVRARHDLPACAISGTPSAPGNSLVAVTVRDSFTPAESTSANLMLVIVSQAALTIISTDSSGNPSRGIREAVGTLQFVVLSETGRYAAFLTLPAGLIAPHAKFSQIYWHDSCVGASNCTPRALLASAGSGAPPTEGNGASFEPTISADGHYVGFLSEATDLEPKPYPIKRMHIYIRSLCLGVNADEGTAVISADGHYAAFAGFIDMGVGVVEQILLVPTGF